MTKQTILIVEDEAEIREASASSSPAKTTPS